MSVIFLFIYCKNEITQIATCRVIRVLLFLVKSSNPQQGKKIKFILKNSTHFRFFFAEFCDKNGGREIRKRRPIINISYYAKKTAL